MKVNLKKIIGMVLLLGITAVSLNGCMEHRYYHEHNQHSPDYYSRHHLDPPPPVNAQVEIHN